MKIILAIDDSPTSDKVVDSVLERDWPANTEFKIITVLEPVCVSFKDVTISEFSHTAAEIYEQRKNDAGHLCEKVCKKIESTFPQTSTVYQIKDGAPWAEIVKEAEAWSADSILVGSHGKDICPTNRPGSVGRAVVEHSPCSVTVI